MYRLGATVALFRVPAHPEPQGDQMPDSCLRSRKTASPENNTDMPSSAAALGRITVHSAPPKISARYPSIAHAVGNR